MKIPGLFTKAPKYHKFEYKPRYWDPKKEEHEAREARIREEIAKENGIAPPENESTYDYHARMKGAFQSARRRSIGTASRNRRTTFAPPAKSMPQLIPFFM